MNDVSEAQKEHEKLIEKLLIILGNEYSDDYRMWTQICRILYDMGNRYYHLWEMFGMMSDKYDNTDIEKQWAHIDTLIKNPYNKMREKICKILHDNMGLDYYCLWGMLGMMPDKYDDKDIIQQWHDLHP